MNKQAARIRRAKRTRMRIRALEVSRLCVYKTPRHMYAQVTTSDGSKTLACASTLDKELKKKLKVTGNVDAAKEVGKLLAKRALEAGIREVAFDRSGFLYHGRIKALADAAREVGLEF
ncbi:50S ribosomal protein L18 [Aquicella lusitana]|uniref:Large ribosomal subunit protein uL18 n=1 Tax=Aquicella lusitana TaxID=254246 RepID=A0A370GU04_9COXI|nr:50S ribosomal protein L18 [Aquicella lusitana]RDI46961.1 LSU ribosomal protein L18P [Aquicella lusitana]VVC73851.1 50S ribosomal protein L18 [Aquicella lusitana]